MSLTPTEKDIAYAKGVEHGYSAATEMRWRKYPGSAPPPNGDGRALVWIETGDGMAYIGLRCWRTHSDGDGHGWYSGNAEESGNVTHWMPLPQPPWLIGSSEKASERCPASWRVVASGAVIRCTLPAGHEGRHRAPETFSNEEPT